MNENQSEIYRVKEIGVDGEQEIVPNKKDGFEESSEQNTDAQTKNPDIETSSDNNETVDLSDDLSYEDFRAESTNLLKQSETLIGSIQAAESLSNKDIQNLSDNIEKINELLQQDITDQDTEGIYPKLLELRPKLIELKVKEVIKDYSDLVDYFSDLENVPNEEKIYRFAVELSGRISLIEDEQELMTDIIVDALKGKRFQSTQELKLETFEEAYEEIESDDEKLAQFKEMLKDDDNGKEKYAKLKENIKLFGAISILAGTTFAEMTFDKSDIDLGAFISFVLNPTGKLAESNVEKYAGENQEVPYYMFKEKFRNYKQVGEALSKSVDKLLNVSEFSDWINTNFNDLKGLENKGDSQKTADLLIDFKNNVLKDDDKLWVKFSEIFTSTLYNKEGLKLSTESIDFLKEKLNGNGDKLKEYWHISKQEDDEKIENEQDEKNQSSSNDSQ